MKHRGIKAALKSFVVFLAIYLLLSFTVVMLIYEGLFARTEVYEYSLFISKEDVEQLYQSSDASFESRGFPINAVIYGDNKDKIVILGHAKNSSSQDMLPEAKFFLDNGFSVMTMDFTGHSKSGGNSQYGLQQCVFDMENAIAEVRTKGYSDIYLYGIGIGGYASAACAAEDGVKGVAAIAAFSSISDMTLQYATDNMSILGYLEYPIMMLYQYITYGSDIENSAIKGINESNVPVIIINGTNDETVKYNGAALINASDKLRNDNITFKTVESGYHSSIMRTEEAVDIINNFNKDAYALYNDYQGEVPVADIEALYSSVDKEAVSSLNEMLMQEILSVFGVL